MHIVTLQDKAGVAERTLPMGTVTTSDGCSFPVPPEITAQIHVLSNAFEDCDDQFIPIPVHSDVFKKVLEFYTFRNNTNDFADIEDYDTTFFNISVDLLFDIISASNYLNAPELLDTACSAAATLLRHKNPEEIRAILNIENVCTTAEEEIRKAHGWAFVN